MDEGVLVWISDSKCNELFFVKEFFVLVLGV